MMKKTFLSSSPAPARTLIPLQNITVRSSSSTQRNITGGIKTWSILLQQQPPLNISIKFANNTTSGNNSSHTAALQSTGTLTAIDCEHGAIHVRHLTTPIGNYKAALLRLNDIDRLDCIVKSECFDDLLSHALRIAGKTDIPALLQIPEGDAAQHTSIVLKDTNVFARDGEVRKYWSQRYSLFSKFDSIQTDKEGLFSATPECIAQYVASRVGSEQKVVWDAFAGVGGNCCHFGSFERVIATDLSAARLQMCRHNCEVVYGVAGIEFAVGDFMELCQTQCADVVILSPPWGGPQYLDVLDPSALLLDNIISVPCSGVELLRQGIQAVKPGGVIVYMLPKNVNNESVVNAGETLSLGAMEVEDVYVDGVCKMTLAFYRLFQ